MTADIKEGWEMLEVWAGKKKKMVWKTVMLKSEGSSEPAKITRQNSAGVWGGSFVGKLGSQRWLEFSNCLKNNPTKEATSASL